MATATQYALLQVRTQVNFRIYSTYYQRHYLNFGVLKYKWILKLYYIAKYDFSMKNIQKWPKVLFLNQKIQTLFFNNVKHFFECQEYLKAIHIINKFLN